MTARKTASFGEAYNYSQIEYPYQEFLPELKEINQKVSPIIGFEPNNCLINYYLDGKSKMGYHSDQIDILEPQTGVAIISVGAVRTLKFRNILNPELFESFELTAGSLIYMTQEVQKIWQHSIPQSNTEEGRISITLRKMSKTIKIGADELILWLRKNNKATKLPNDEIHGLGIKIHNLIVNELGGTKTLENKSTYWSNQDGDKHIGKYYLPKTSTQYEIEIKKMEQLYDNLSRW